MAEFVMKKIAAERGMSLEIASAATSDEERGNPVYPPAREELKRHGISCAGKRAKLLTKEDGEEYELLLCMDESNLRRAKKIVGEENAYKCQKLLLFAGENRDVADPWYTGNFTKTYDDLVKGIDGLLSEL